MYRYQDVRVVHLEVTERCQAGCPMCGRHDWTKGGLNENVKETSLSLNDSRAIFSDSFIKQLSYMFMCGNLGDPLFAPDTLAIFERFRDTNYKMRLDMFTNGGARPVEWWRDLALLLTPDTRSRVIFAIDGLEDTNHLYRRGVVWDNVMKSVETFIGSGGLAEWHFLVFKHNEHQVNEARDLARKMGFIDFKFKKSTRFYGTGDSFMGLELPSNARYRNDKYDFMRRVDEEYGSYDNFIDKTPIKCMVKDEKSVYVSSRGDVYPCCWLGFDPLATGVKDPTKVPLFKYIEDFDSINALKTPLETIFANGYFDRIERSWETESVAAGRLKTCARACSSHNNFFKAQFDS